MEQSLVSFYIKRDWKSPFILGREKTGNCVDRDERRERWWDQVSSGGYDRTRKEFGIT